jgi:putative Ca2+/H+ antiporter (TMEM165/GDT1 family)
MHGLALLLSIFGLVFVAELPDKTALAALVLATKHRPVPVLVGAAAALAIQSMVAVAAGSLVSLLPSRPVHIVSGAVFLVSAVLMWRREKDEAANEDGKAPTGFWRSTWLVFGVVFIAEWGDLTQVATATLAARYRQPLLVFSAATLALWSVAALAVLVGNRAGKLLDPRRTQRIAAVLFAAVGVLLVVGVL